jgi:hypothetical protein
MRSTRKLIEVTSLTTAHFYPSPLALQRTLPLILILLASAMPHYAKAQIGTPASVAYAMASLPDAPSSSSNGIAVNSNEDTFDVEDNADTTGAPRLRHRHYIASRTDITIEPGQTAPSLTPQDKVSLGLKESFTLFSVVGWLASAGYSHVTNGSPNYGTDSGAFGERLGATALRNTSEHILSNAVFAPIFHDDPRYYKMGPGHNVVKRTLYAATRTLITKADDGRPRPNYSLLSGNLVGSILTNAYYPSPNQGFGQTAKTFGTSVGGSALGFIVTEFLDDALDIVHLKKLEPHSTE